MYKVRAYIDNNGKRELIFWNCSYINISKEKIHLIIIFNPGRYSGTGERVFTKGEDEKYKEILPATPVDPLEVRELISLWIDEKLAYANGEFCVPYRT